ncbi:MAG: amylo-alpha-1,6-glucosidase [Acidimicrobiales bacterium]
MEDDAEQITSAAVGTPPEPGRSGHVGHPVSDASTSPFAGVTPVASLAHADGVVTLVEGQTFSLSGRTGDMSSDFPHGLFVLDTRVLSRWELRVGGERLEPLTVDIGDPFSGTFVGRAHPAPGQADADVVVFRHRDIGWGMRERIRVTNHGLAATSMTVELRCEADLADLFAVKENRVPPLAALQRERTARGVRFTAGEETAAKSAEVRFDPEPADDAEGLTWRITLPPRATWALCAEVTISVSGQLIEPRFTCTAIDRVSVPAQRLASWRATLPEVTTDHVGLADTLRRTGEDLGALRIFDPEHPDVPILAAGAPWFMTVFGRDSLLTAWMTLLADPSLAQGVLETLARFQGDDVVATTEEEPGKILHEMRFDAARGLALRAGDRYYGSIDATPLFVMLLGELRRWDLADDAVTNLLPHADRALEWIEDFGDRDGDGYVEYQRLSERGLANQGWKDSWDAIRHADGTLATTPIALCEVQGYVYAAYVARAHFAAEAGDTPTLERYRRKAHDLRRQFNEDFWLEEHGWYALGLDADKRPIDALASNVGHCLWTGIVDVDRAGAVAQRLVSRDLFSDWGIRTLATSMAAYNPVSYHNGSVWPHDNAICAAGLARYGFVEEAHQVIGAQLAVAAHQHGRLPELFAGFDREDLATPAAYPTSCSPQAWASAAPLLWLRTLLRLDPWAPLGRVSVAPELPPWIRRLRVEGIAIAGQRLTVDVDAGQVEIAGSGSLEILREARGPLSTIDGGEKAEHDPSSWRT